MTHQASTSRARLPTNGRPHDELLKELETRKAGDARWREGRVFSLVYQASEAHEQFLKAAHALYFCENALNPMAFKSLWQLEHEVVQMSAALFSAPPTACGTMTSGGTESLLLAVKAARDRAKKKRPWILRPEVVLPSTAHVAFDKACHSFGLIPRYAPIGEDMKVDLSAYERLIGRSTVLLVASAPQYPHGVIDPIGPIGEIAARTNIPFHVDSCIGGFALPFLERLGQVVPPWDFRVPGVTSISADLHKYGYAAKGASVLVYRDLEHLESQFFISTDWSGGVYASPTMLGTRAGGPIAAAWAALQALGEDGYLELIKGAAAARDQLLQGLARIPSLRVLGRPESTIVAYTSNDRAVDIYAVADALEAKGWTVDRQQRPPSIHLTLGASHRAIIEPYLSDLAQAVDEARSDPGRRERGHAAMYGLMAKVPVRGLVRQGVKQAMAEMYGPNAKLPNGEGLESVAGGRLSRWVGPILAGLERVERARARITRRART